MMTNAKCVLLIALVIGLAPSAGCTNRRAESSSPEVDSTPVADPYLVQVPATLDPQAPIDYEVKRECGLELLLGNNVFQKVNDKFPGSSYVEKADNTEKGKVLIVTITSVLGAGGTSWTGPKSMTIRADVVQTGKVIATIVKTRDSMGGVFGAVRGRCSILARVADALAEDVADWLPDTP
jgi:hypothetical protein